MIYLSHYLGHSTPAYGNSPNDLKITKASCIDHGDSSNSLRIEMKNHIGTHIDLPRHFALDGKVLNDYPASFWEFENVQLLDLPCQNGQIITIKDLVEKVSLSTELLLIRSGFEKFRDQEIYWSNNPGFDRDVGEHLRVHFPKIKAIGFDFISLTSYTNRPLGREAHKSFLGPLNGKEPILIVEDMKLGHLTKAPSKVLISPLLVDQADGVPVTIFAFP